MCFVPNTLDGIPLIESDNSSLTQRRNKEKGMAVSVVIRDTTSCSNKKLLGLKRFEQVTNNRGTEIDHSTEFFGL